jgi:hypothetical protein
LSRSSSTAASDLVDLDVRDVGQPLEHGDLGVGERAGEAVDGVAVDVARRDAGEAGDERRVDALADLDDVLAGYCDTVDGLHDTDRGGLGGRG